jgi:polyferredoxin
MGMPSSTVLRIHKMRMIRCLVWCFLCVFLLLPNLTLAQYQKAPPDFGGTYVFPTPAHPEPAESWLRAIDVLLLATALVVAAWLVLKSRNRRGLMLLSLGCLAYFGFYRKGCLCAVGAIQNVALCLASPQYIMSLSAIAVFFLPLAATLLFGRVFCGGVCPLGALQDLVILKPLKVPVRLDRILRWLQYIYLALAVFFAGWGLQMKIGAWQIKTGQRFLICDYDPFVVIFRRSGPFYMVLIAATFVIAGLFIGRPYCRWLCPYGAILSMLSRVSWRKVSITPDKELDCGKCADACPCGAIRALRADRATCMACARCYEVCPRQKRLVALTMGTKKAAAGVAVPPRKWEAIAKTWVGVLAAAVLAASFLMLVVTYLHARHTMPSDKAFLESLKEKAKSDAEIQKVLQPELTRQHDAAEIRRLIYGRGGDALLISAAVLMFWLTWLRPKSGAGAGLPGSVLRFVERMADHCKKI